MRLKQIEGASNMVFYTGDPHGDVAEIVKFCRRMRLQSSDTLVILGDVGANYYLNERDKCVKEQLNSCGPTILCIHGNHECRPARISSYVLHDWNGGQVYVQPEYPHVLFAMDGEVYTLESRDHLVIGGAYSVDKYYRLMRGFRWWPDEQPDKATKVKVEQRLADRNWQVPIVLSHTCPFKYEPTEAFLPGIDQSSVDDSTERWLDTIDNRLTYDAWYCGHWHINKRIEKMHFLFHEFEATPEL